MGIFDALKGLARPYDDEDEFYDVDDGYVEQEDDRPAKAATGKSGNPFFSSDTPEYDAPAPQSAPVARPALNFRRDRERDGGRFLPRAERAAVSNQIIVVKPQRFDDAKTIFEHLRSGQIVLMSIDGIENGIARRILDFLSGATYASGGKIQKVDRTSYIVTPNNVGLMGSDLMEDVESGGQSF